MGEVPQRIYKWHPYESVQGVQKGEDGMKANEYPIFPITHALNDIVGMPFINPSDHLNPSDHQNLLSPTYYSEGTPVISSMAFNSSALKARFSSAATFSSICSTLEAPINTLVTAGRRRFQANAICANVCPRS
jgi:hypothetical protein